jgi:hypothetical protein
MYHMSAVMVYTKLQAHKKKQARIFLERTVEEELMFLLL